MIRKSCNYSIADIVILPGNHKDHPEQQLEQLESNIRTYGFTQPIILSERGELIAGAGRLEVVRRMGWHDVPAIVCEGISTAEARALRISDNRIPELGQVNQNALAMELADISAELPSLEGLGFEADELGELLGDFVFDDCDFGNKPDSPPGGDDRLVESDNGQGLPPDMIDGDGDDSAGSTPWSRTKDAKAGVMASVGRLQSRIPDELYDRALRHIDNLGVWLDENLPL